MRAIVRSIPASFVDALAMAPQAIDVALARVQHAAYVAALEAAGATVRAIAAREDCPDCCFVEDTAVVVGRRALIANPGAPSRRAEVDAVAAMLASCGLEVARMVAPATLDGGDCMRVGDMIYVGRSARTNAAGIARLAEVFAGIRVVAVELPAGILHLKCVVTPLGGDRVLLARDSLAAATFAASIVWVPADERYAANAVAIGTHAIVAAEYPGTHQALAAAGFTLHPVPTSEVRKADGSLTCQSILLDG